MRKRAARWIYSKARVSDFLDLSSVVSEVVGDDGCRCYCRRARNGRPCSLCHRPLESVFLIHPILGRKEDSAPSGQGVPASRMRLEAVGQGMAVRNPWTLLGVSGFLWTIDLGSRSGQIGLITLDVNCAGARSAGNPLATCDVAGAGNQLTVRIVRHSEPKRGALDTPMLRSNGASSRPYRGG